MKVQIHALVFLITIIALVFVIPLAGHTSDTKDALNIKRISVDDARARVQTGEAILVCSYKDTKCKSMLLEGAMLLSEFEGKLSSFPIDQEIIFYCG